ncbi:MAG: glycosyltransferase [Pseudoflavonifractor sp.]|nr:glycosyltransferase [Pseudoflavonifractor sp.]
MISIITAIYNQLAMNRLYYNSLTATTDGDWELIVIDNGSTDGSREFFESLGGNVTVIANDGNYSYPYCQNQGLAMAKGDVYAFFNNDILLSPHWDTRMMQVLGQDGYEVLSLASNDRMGDEQLTRRLSRRWKHIKYPLIFTLGQSAVSLRLMARLTYGDWTHYCRRVWERYGTSTRIGFSGSAVMMTRRGVGLVGEWDPTEQAADFDLFMRTLQRSREHGDIRPLSIVSGVMHHHYRRLTLRCDYPPFKDATQLRGLEEKWGTLQLAEAVAMLR